MQVPKARMTIGQKGEEVQNGRGMRNNGDPGKGREEPYHLVLFTKGLVCGEQESKTESSR